MSTPVLRENQGSAITATYSALGTTLASTTTAGTYSSATRINNSSIAALLADVRVKGSFGTSPAGTGVLQLCVIDRDLSGNIGPTPSASVLGKFYTLTPTPSGTSSVVYGADSIPLPYDCDLYIMNNATGQTFTYDTGTTPYPLTIQPWSPGT